MSGESFLVWLAIGAIAGWLAGFVVKGSRYGLVGNVALGVTGAVLGGWAFATLGIGAAAGSIGALFGATLGAIGVVSLYGLVKRA